MKSGNLNFMEPSRPLQACNGTALPYIYIYHYSVFIEEQFNNNITIQFSLDVDTNTI